jgi:hypothetical protein
MCQARAAARDYARARTQGGFGTRGSRVLGHAHRVGRTRTRGGSASLEGLAGLAEPSKRVGLAGPVDVRFPGCPAPGEHVWG